MDLLNAGLLLAAGLAAGTINAVAGGGSLITFPALIAIGMPPIQANVTNSVSVCPGYLAAVAGSKDDLPHRSRVLPLIPTAALGATAGGLLLLNTSEDAFKVVIPILVLGATAVLAFQDRLRRLVGHPADLSPRRRTLTLQGMVALGSVYGGYFGAALGVMLVAGLALVLDETLARVSALKNVVSAVVGLTTVVVFSAFGPVDWAAVAIVAPATLVGGYFGARLARQLPPAVLKGVIVAFGMTIGVLLI
ncbi:sulfite exporter TauE/SafE family protein [Micromonospora sp. NPDC050417]|uniref:sulfite exporter TauE/SafE family protein n=1 Tax=Micromonospora sp. NPDC050417 TaxID=3364280 RepID=UPI0037A24F4C